MSQVTNWEDTCPKVLILLGSNATSTVAESANLISQALERIAALGVQIDSQSRIYETPCFPAGAGPDFANLAAGLRTDLPPEVLLALLHQVEDEFGRERPSRWAARTLDIDLIGYGDRVCPDASTLKDWIEMPLEGQMQQAPSELILPHPRLQDRGFALIPLCEIAPTWRHPFFGQTLAELCAALPESAKTGVKPLCEGE